MNPILQKLRDTASFSAWWYLVPFGLCTMAIAAVVVVQALTATEPDAEAAAAVPVAAPAQGNDRDS